MAGTKSNGVSGGERRRRSRATNGAAAGQAPAPASNGGDLAPNGADSERWLGRLDALVDRMAGLDDRGAIIDQMVGEAMQLLPADEVRVYADASTITAPLFIDEHEGAPARAVIPLAIAGRHFGAVEIAMKPQRTVSPGERALSIALARQCALAIDGLMLRKAQRPAGGTADAAIQPLPVVEAATPPAPVIEIGGVTPVVERASEARSMSQSVDLAELQATLGRLEGDLRALAKLARNAELPPAAWVDRAEATALRRLDEARDLLGTGVKNAA